MNVVQALTNILMSKHFWIQQQIINKYQLNLVSMVDYPINIKKKTMIVYLRKLENTLY